MGAMLGRAMGELMFESELIKSTDVGMYALVGAAAVLSGITRMTLTIAVILIEVSAMRMSEQPGSRRLQAYQL